MHKNKLKTGEKIMPKKTTFMREAYQAEQGNIDGIKEHKKYREEQKHEKRKRLAFKPISTIGKTAKKRAKRSESPLAYQLFNRQLADKAAQAREELKQDILTIEQWQEKYRSVSP
jgi:hypothetical protein